MGIIRKTPSIDLLLGEFDNDQIAVSAIEMIRRLDTKLNKTTIYRVLEKLEEDGVVHSFLDNNGIRWYARCRNCSVSGHSDVHPHFQCLSCGKVDCLTVDVQIPDIPNREVQVSRVFIQGKCEVCLN